MGKTIRMPTMVPGWVIKDLMFLIDGPPLTGPLAGYKFHLIVEGSEGETYYEDDLGKPDGCCGRLYARGRYLNPVGGDLTIAGLWDKYPVTLNDNQNINPLINGRCRYKTNTSGEFLMFKVEPRTTSVASVTNTDETSETQTGVSASQSTETSIEPGGVGAKFGGVLTRPGDQTTNKKTQTQTRNVTSVTGLIVTQIAAPPSRPRRRGGAATKRTCPQGS